MRLSNLNLNMDCGEDLPGIFSNVDMMLMPYLKYCNIACGFHAGSVDTIKNTLHLAIRYGVKPGAHPSFKDRENFGRNYIDVPLDVLIGQVSEQISLLNELANETGVPLFHVKAHGALYNAAMKNEKEALAITTSVLDVNKELIIFVMKGSTLEKMALQNGCKVMYETFGDRSYQDKYTLVPRNLQGALKENASEVLEQIMQLSSGRVVLINGKSEEIDSDTICLHGDHPKIMDTLALLEQMYFLG